ncbi:MAG TPA: beta-ketoacyl-[acyl-carrier-protein] synthase family protein [Thermoleophilaceae bacterium]
MNRTPAAITGIGAVTPLGVGASTLYERWRDGHCGIEDGVGECRGFDASEFMSRKQERRTERFVQFGLVASTEATAQAGWDGDRPPYPPERVACVLGVSLGGTQVMFDQYRTLEERGPDAVWPLTIPVSMPNATPAILAMAHGFRGESRSIASACSSSAQAIGEGLRMLRQDDADAVIVGGSEACLTPFVSAAFKMAGALSRSGISRPFDRRRDGFVMAEGGGIVILEDPDKARARGAEILGYVTGYGSTTDGYHLTAPAEDGEICAAAIGRALFDAGRAPEDVDYVNAHGTSTTGNDRAETNALKVALGRRAHEIPVSSTKSVVGHSIGGAGAVEAVATLLTLRNRVVPPTVGLEEPDPDLDLNYVPGAAVRLPGPAGGHDGNGNGNGNGRADRCVAISNSFAFGGHNAVLVIEA